MTVAASQGRFEPGEGRQAVLAGIGKGCGIRNALQLNHLHQAVEDRSRITIANGANDASALEIGGKVAQERRRCQRQRYPRVVVRFRHQKAPPGEGRGVAGRE